MKRIDVTKPVMERVVRFEEQRTKRWLLVFVLTVAFIAALIGISILRTYNILLERQTLDVIEIIYQDREIIAEFWQDTLLVAFEELPQRTLIFGLGLVCLLICLWVITRHRRQVAKRRLAELAKRKVTRDNG